MTFAKISLPARSGLFVLLMCPLAALAAPPANDNFASPVIIAGASGSESGTNVDATREAGEPNHALSVTEPANGRSVWWRWTATGTGVVTLDTAGSGFDTVVAVYTGSAVTDLTLVAAGDDTAFGVYTTRLAFQATAGVTYQIAVDGFDGAAGAITLLWTLGGEAPSNDNFANGTVIPEGGGEVIGSNVNATKEPDEPWHAFIAGGRSVWWRWTPNTSGSYAIDTIGSSFDTLLAVYTGDNVFALEVKEYNNDIDPNGINVSRLILSAVAGTTYHIAVDGYGFESGDILLVVEPTDETPPPNDNFADRVVIVPAGGNVPGDSTTATKEPGEPEHPDNPGGRSVWWTWTPNVSATVAISTAGSSFDTLLAVYTGSTLGSLNLAAYNHNESVISSTSLVTFDAVAGTNYQIVVDGYNGDRGLVQLSINTVDFVPLAPVANPATGVTSSGFAASWSPAGGATGYRLDVSTVNNFATFVPGYENLDVGDVGMHVVAGLAPSTDHYYRVRASNSVGQSQSSQTIPVTTAEMGLGDLPAVTAQPPSHSIAVDGSVAFSVAASGNPQPTIRWQRSTDGGANWSDLADGGVFAGTATATLRVTKATIAMNDHRFRAVVTNSAGSATSDSGTLSVAASAGVRLINLSTRAFAGSGDSTLIMGFFIAGTGSKTLLIRGVGPQLGLDPHNVPSVVQNPSLTVYSGGTPIGSNDNWDAGDASAFAAVGAFALTPGSNDAAMIITLPQGGYTVHLGNPGNVAEALIEVYDLSRDLGTRLVNLSCRLNLNPGQTVIPGTFLLGGQKPLLVRNAGPGLALALPELIQPGDVLPDPRLTVYRGETVVAENDDWNAALAPHFSAVGAFGFENGSKDAALRSDFTQGGYTVHATGTGGGGIALIEIYESP